MLHRKDFKAIAEIIRKELERNTSTVPEVLIGCGITCENIALDLADYLSTTNPNFDRDKFLTACGVN